VADQIVITEKTSQANDVRAAVGSRYGDILPAEGHLFDLVEPEDAVPAWKRWSLILLRPEGLYGTRPAEGGSKPPNSEPFARRFAPPNKFGLLLTATAKAN
jgi:DNA topoisomerase-3